jgi:polyisoprenoid-binding protein YceI
MVQAGVGRAPAGRPRPARAALSGGTRVIAGLLAALLGAGTGGLACAAPSPSPAMAANPAPAAAAASPGAAAALAAGQPIDPRRSSARGVVTLRLRGAVEGRLPGVSGMLLGSPAAGWRVQVRLDAQGIRFDGPRWMERSTRSPAFLAVDRYPAIRFDSEAFDDATLHAGGVLRGQLTLRGRRRPVAFDLLPATCARPGRDCDIRVQGGVSRHDFGMVAHRTMVLDRVELRIQVRLRGPST